MTTALRALALLGSTGALVLRPALTPTPLACNLRPRAISAMMDADSDGALCYTEMQSLAACSKRVSIFTKLD